MATFSFPKRPPGRPSRESAALYDEAVERLIKEILKIQSTPDLDFKVSARGWGYLLEGDNIITKADLDAVEQAINECRKDGRLPLDICAMDESRAFEHVEKTDETTPQEEAEALAEAVGWDPGEEKDGRLIIDRFGLNYEFIEANNLTWIDNLITGSGNDLGDPKNKDHWRADVQDYIKKYGVRKVEANALVKRPKEGRELYREAILRYVSLDGVARFEAARKREQQKLAKLIAKLMRETY